MLCCVLVQVEASIQEALSGMSQGLASLEQQMGEAGSSEAQLNARLEKLAGGRVWEGGMGPGGRPLSFNAKSQAALSLSTTHLADATFDGSVRHC
jgi:hypothetical protein